MNLGFSWLALFAILLVTGWLWWRARSLRLRAQLSEPIPLQPPWFELVGSLTEGVKGASSRAEAVNMLAGLLQSELGAQGVRVLHVCDVQGEAATLRAVPTDPLLGQPKPFQVGLTDGLLGRAIAGQGVVGSPESGFVMAWADVALEFSSTELAWAAESLQQLLAVAHSLVAMAPLPAAESAVHSQTQTQTDLLELLARCIDVMPASALLFEPSDLRLVGLNHEAEREFAIQREHVVGETLREVFGEVASAVAEPGMRSALAQDEPLECEYAWSDRLGRRKLLVRHRAVRDAQGQAQLLLVFARDVSIERQTQGDLQETQNRFLEFSQAMEDSLFIADPERRTFYFLAGGTYELWGVTPEQVASGHLFTHIIEEDRHLLQERMRCEVALEPADFVFRVMHPVKGLTFVRTRSRTSVMPNGSLRVYGVASDVTKEQAREGQLRAARDAAEAASLAKSHFMANMSHEIRTPMNGILGMTELLLHTQLGGNQRKYAEAVYESGEVLMSALGDILEWTKLDAGELDLVNADFEVYAALEDTLEVLAPKAHQKRLELNLRVASGVPLRLHGDVKRLRQIVSKFVGNAIKFTDSGEVIVDVREYPGKQTGWVLECSVKDTGIGIDADVLPTLFQAFSQGSGGLSRRHGGVGLGLATAGRLVQLMGGSVDVASTPGVGSVFQFKLPFGMAPSVVRSSTFMQSPSERLQPLNVLLVEDHPTSREVVRSNLRDHGFGVTAVSDGRQALDLLAQRAAAGTSFDVALVDFDMPHVDAIVFAQELKSTKMHPNMKLILMAAGRSSADVQHAHQVGFDGLLAKPVRRAELGQVTLGICGRHAEGVRVTPELKGRVLVVEDNVVNQEVIGQMLRKLRLNVRIAGGALQGLRALCEEHYDLILMDIMMPGMDGIEALRWFRHGDDDRFEFVTPRNTPVVAVTANAMANDEAQFLSLGFSDYLPKPLRQSQLVDMLSKHLPLNREPSTGVPAGLVPEVEVKESVLDPKAMNQLRELDPQGKSKLIERVLRAFLQSVERLLPQLEQAGRSADLAGVRHVAHTFKSSSASIGAIQLSASCADLETLIRQGTVDNLDQRVRDLSNEIALVSKALQNLLDRPT